MKRLAVIIGLGLALGLGGGAVAQASSGHHHHPVAKKKCKDNWTFREGKCRRVKPREIPPPVLPSPHSIVRATLSWDGPAYLDMQVGGQQGRSGYFPGEGGVLNEIPNAHYSRGTGGPGPETETFIDDLFSDGYGSVPFPNGNREFGFGYCYRGSAGPEPSHVDYTWVTSWGLVDHQSWTINPPDWLGTSCATFVN
jgi:hypothetical protein